MEQAGVYSQGDASTWRAIVSGALAGFAATLILTTLGSAIGMTAGLSSEGVDGNAVGTGAGIWWLLTVVVAGVIGGRVFSVMAPPSVEYHRAIAGTQVWVLGVLILLALLAMGVGNIVGGLGGSLGAVADNAPRMNQAEATQAARNAAEVGTGVTWGLLLSQILGLGATIIAAGRRRGETGDRGYSAEAGLPERSR